MIFDRSNVTVCNVQMCCCCQQDSLKAYVGWLVPYLSSVGAPLAVDQLSPTDVDMLIVSTNVLVCKQTILSVVVAHKSAGVQTKLSLQALAVPQDGYGIFIILHCGMFTMQLKFYNCHMKQPEI